MGVVFIIILLALVIDDILFVKYGYWSISTMTLRGGEARNRLYEFKRDSGGRITKIAHGLFYAYANNYIYIINQLLTQKYYWYH